MNTTFSGKALLATLPAGLAPHAEALVETELCGPDSLFGVSRACDSLAGYAGGRSLESVLPGGRLLWGAPEQADTLALARGILERDAPDDNGLSVPAPVYLTGRCLSTFPLAWQLCEQGLLPDWGAVLCSCQTQGRGQLRRVWHSPPGNLYVSFRLPDDPKLRGDAASPLVGGLLTEAFRALGFPLWLKWPNDLLRADDKKTGGLLLEEKNGVILAGLGVNLVSSPPEAQLRADGATQAAVLFAGKQSRVTLSPFPLWRHLVSALILAYTRRIATLTPGDFDSLLAWKGRMVVLAESDGNRLAGRHMGLGKHGGLRLQRRNGDEEEFFSGSLSLADGVSPGAGTAVPDIPC